VQLELLLPVLLPVVLLPIDFLRSLVLRGVNAGPFLSRHHSIGLGFVLHVIDVALLLFQPICFMLGELTACDSLVDALLLIRLPLIDPRRLSLSIGHPGRQEHSADHKNSVFHCLPPVW
jgi:hypothetical protein